MTLPGAIIYVNGDISTHMQALLASQLLIIETITGQEFDLRVQAQPDYVSIVHTRKLRVLVLRNDFFSPNNHNLADVILFVKNGLATVLLNKLGPPSLTFDTQRINIYDILRFVGSDQVAILPNLGTPPTDNDEESEAVFGAGGIVAEELRDQSGVSIGPPDEDDDPAFLNRK